jgi:hypothetical protein
MQLKSKLRRRESQKEVRHLAELGWQAASLPSEARMLHFLTYAWHFALKMM